MQFKRGQAAKKAVGIGIFGRHEFETDSEAADFIVPLLPQILGVDSVDDLPDDVLSFRGVDNVHYKRLVEYTVDCIHIKEGAFRTFGYDQPDGSLLFEIAQRFNDGKILRKIIKAAEEKGYHVIRKR